MYFQKGMKIYCKIHYVPNNILLNIYLCSVPIIVYNIVVIYIYNVLMCNQHPVIVLKHVKSYITCLIALNVIDDGN